MVRAMPLGLSAFALIVVGFVLFPIADAAGAASVIVAVAALPVLGYRDGTLRGLRWVGLVPIYFLPAWAILAGFGVLANRAREAPGCEGARR